MDNGRVRIGCIADVREEQFITTIEFSSVDIHLVAPGCTSQRHIQCAFAQQDPVFLIAQTVVSTELIIFGSIDFVTDRVAASQIGEGAKLEAFQFGQTHRGPDRHTDILDREVRIAILQITIGDLGRFAGIPVVCRVAGIGRTRFSHGNSVIHIRSPEETIIHIRIGAFHFIELDIRNLHVSFGGVFHRREDHLVGSIGCLVADRDDVPHCQTIIRQRECTLGDQCPVVLITGTVIHNGEVI